MAPFSVRYVFQLAKYNDNKPFKVLPLDLMNDLSKKLNRSEWFVLGVKLLISGLFSSDFVDLHFKPFLDSFSELGISAWKLGQGHFPYPPMMAILLLPFAKFASLGVPIFFQNLFFHIPLLISDLVCYLSLKRILPRHDKQLFLFYFLSPILIYATYVHTQLDLISTSVLVVSVFYFIKNRYFFSFLFIGFSIAIKWHTVMALPFYFLYLEKNKELSLGLVARSLVLVGLPTILSFLVLGGGIFELGSIFFVKEGGFLLKSYVEILDLKIYFFPFFYMTCLGVFFNYPKINRELFLGALGIIFLGTVILVYPNPAWFVWGLPFVVYSFSKNTLKLGKVTLLYFSMSFIYLLFFLFFYEHPIHSSSTINFLGHSVSLRVDSENLRNIVFTSLVVVVSMAIYAVYRQAIQNNLIYKRRFQAFLIGIGGDSGAGKTTFVDSLKSLLGRNMVKLEGDGAHKWERGDENWKTYTHLNPKANELHQQLSHLLRLKLNFSTFRSSYNHDTGKFDPKNKIEPKDFIVLAGLHPFYLKGARDHIDFKIFLDTDEEIRKNWKLFRDQSERGYSIEQVEQQMDARREDSKKYIDPQKKFADLVIRYKSNESIDMDKLVDESQLSVEYSFDLDLPLEEFLNQVSSCGIEIVKHEYDSDLSRQIVEIRGPINFEASCMQHFYTDFFELFNRTEIAWQSGIMGLNQAVVLHCLSHFYIGIFQD